MGSQVDTKLGLSQAPRPPSSLRHPAPCPQSLLARPAFVHRQLLCSVSTLTVLTRVSFSASSLTHTGPPTQGVLLYPENSQCGAGSPGTWSDPAFSREGALAVPLPVPELRAGRRVPQRSPTQGPWKKVMLTEGTFQAVKAAFLWVLTLRPTLPGNLFPHLKVSGAER